MPVAHYAGRAVSVDADGFLTDSSQWTPDIAEAIAAEAGIAPLTAEHWTVLALCREDAAQRGFPPCLKRLCELTGLREALLGQLFPGSPGPLAARIAGLPGPEGASDTDSLASFTDLPERSHTHAQSHDRRARGGTRARPRGRARLRHQRLLRPRLRDALQGAWPAPAPPCT